MDGVKPRQGRYRGSRAQHRPVQRPVAAKPQLTSHTGRQTGERYWLVRSLGKVASKRRQTMWAYFQQTEFAKWPHKNIINRSFVLLTLVLFIVSTIERIIEPFIIDKFYPVTQATRAVLPKQSTQLANFLKYDDKQQKYTYNISYSPTTKSDLQMSATGTPRYTATFNKEPSKGVTVTDPVNNVDFTVKPKFSLGAAKKDQNQIFYPLNRTGGYLVYTNQTASVKEDIVLGSYPNKDNLTFDYQLELGNGLEAKLEKDGSIGVYGASLPLYGNVATGSDSDAELLQKAKQNAPKNKYMFGIPKPFAKEVGKKESSVGVKYELNGNQLRVVAEGLKKASYPLSIDPSIFIESAAQLMYGNNESNVEFDIATEQFKKGTTTGARIDEWTDVGNMNDSVYGQGVATAGGYVYRAGGSSGSKVMPYIADQMVTTSSTSVVPLVVNMPTYRPAGDLYVAIIGFSGATISTPTGWTAVQTGNKLGVFYRIGTASEPATYSWTTNISQKFSAAILRVKNFDSGTPINTSVLGSNNVSPPITYPSVTTTAQGTLVLGTAGFQGDPVNASGYSPSGWADVVAAHSSNTSGDNTQGGIMVSSLDSPPLSGVATGLQTMSNAQTGHAAGNYTSATLAINGITTTAATNQTLQWAHFNSSTKSIESPTPGSDNIACTNWCTNSAYDLPTGSGAAVGTGSMGAAMIAYNGYLYYIGGNDGTNIKSTIYIAKIDAKGEPSKWHPTNPDQSTWTYWYKDSGIYSATALQYTSAYAYNGKMYLVGGDTNTTNHSGATATVMYANILPNGTLGSWTAGTSLGTAAYGVSLQGYNGYLYAIGGNNNGTVLSTVNYMHLNSDGSMNVWQTALVGGGSIITARAQLGGQMASIWGGYLYVAGGCSAVDATTDYCSTVPQDVIVASINADGTLDNGNTMSMIYHQRFGSSFIAWQDSLYRFGGCSRQDTSTGACYGTHLGVQYGPINQDGDASTVSVTQASGSGNCVSPDPYDCNLPPGGTGSGQSGQALSSTLILNGYLYSVGGCTTAACTTMSGNTAYVAISSDGRLKRPPACSGGTYGSWCVDSTNTISGGVGAAGVAVFNGRLYLVGGQNGSNGVNRIYRNTVNADGSLAGAWTAQNLSSGAGTPNVGATNVSYTYAYARANPSSAGTVPGNLYIFGGCSGPTSGAGCTSDAETEAVYKCRILSSGAIDDTNGTPCTTTGQLQIGTINYQGAATAPGLGVHAGTVYANYIYLIGGLAPGKLDLPQVRYAKFDNNNNVVAVTGSSWITSSVEMKHGRRRGTAFGYNGYIYAVGGYDSASTQILDTIEFVKINVSDGSLVDPGTGKFMQSAVTFNQRWGLGIAVSNSYAYIIGGCKVGASPNCSTLDTTVQTFQLYNNDSGAPGGYSVASNLYTTDRIGASAAVYNGYMYIAGGCTATANDCSSGTPAVTSSVMYAQLDTYGAPGTWSSGGALPTALAWGQLEVAGGSLYYVGGQTGLDSTAVSTVYYTTAISAGNPTWSGSAATNGLPAARTQFSSTVWNNRIYVVGGYSGSAVAATVYVSPSLSSGGNISSAWSSSSTSFNVARSGLTTLAYANNLYVIGGYDGTNYLSDVQFAQINASNGNITGSWTYSTNLPFPLRQADGFASNGYVYIFGGRSSTNDCTSRTLIAPISANTSIATGNNPTGIGEWYQTNRNFDGGRYGLSAVNYQGKAYTLGGGCQGIVMQDDFDATTDATQWTSTTGMTAGTICQSTSTSNVLYMTDGASGANGAITKDVSLSSGGTVYFKFYSPNADTGGCYAREANLLGGSPDDVLLRYSTNGGTTWTTLATYPYNGSYDPMKSMAVTIPAAGANTRLQWYMPQGETTDSFSLDDVSIVSTGNTSIAYATNSRVSYTTLLSQPQIATYSRLIDAGKDVTPTVFLMNGLDNSIGARWQMTYRSMNDPTQTVAANACGGAVMSSYGAFTYFGDVTLGTPGAYIPKDGSGTNISCARYFFMTVSIDASQTFGYPEDITRGPTLDNLALFFNSNPGQRLIHGKTFLEGQQQPLDTPCRQSNPLGAACPLP